MNVIGLEVSTSAAKCILYNAETGIVDSVSQPYPAEVADIVSQDPEGIFQAALAVLRAIVQRNDRPVAAIGLSGTWHSLLYLDRHRQPVGRIKTWADVTATETVEALKAEPDFYREFYHKTGCVLHALYPIWKLYHDKKTNPEAFRDVVYLSSQIEYLFERLTGGQAVSRCTASGSGFFNIHTLDWDDELLALAGVKRSMFAELTEATFTLPLAPAIARAVGLPAGIPVTVGAADGALNQVGIGGAREGIMSFSVGTSAALRLVKPAPQLADDPSTWCYYLYNGKRIIGAATHSGNVLSWFAERFFFDRKGKTYSLQDYDQFAAAIEPEKAPYFLPFLYGERCPGWQGKRRGGFLEISPQHNEAHLYYAILEGILFNLYHCYTILASLGGQPAKVLLSGGIIKSPFWRQMAADIFQRDLLVTGVVDESTVGGALFALQAGGGIGQVEDYAVEPTRVLSPRSDKVDVYRKRFAKYLQLYEASRP